MVKKRGVKTDPIFLQQKEKSGNPSAMFGPKKTWKVDLFGSNKSVESKYGPGLDQSHPRSQVDQQQGFDEKQCKNTAK